MVMLRPRFVPEEVVVEGVLLDKDDENNNAEMQTQISPPEYLVAS